MGRVELPTDRSKETRKRPLWEVVDGAAEEVVSSDQF